MDNDKGNFGSRVKQIRERLNMTQVEFSSKLDMSSGSLSEIENNKYRPGSFFFDNIVKAFNVNLYFLLYGVGNMFHESCHYEEKLYSYIGDNKEIQRFIWYFERSPILQHYILAQFRRYLYEEGDLIERDVQVYESENKK